MSSVTFEIHQLCIAMQKRQRSEICIFTEIYCLINAHQSKVSSFSNFTVEDRQPKQLNLEHL